MNAELQAFARATLKTGLATLNETYRMAFRRMYSHDNLDADINDVVDAMSVDQLDWAMIQVRNTQLDLLKKAEQAGLV